MRPPDKETPRNRTPAAAHREELSNRKSSSNVVYLRRHPRPPPTIGELIEAGRRQARVCAGCGGPLFGPTWWRVCRACFSWDRFARRHGVGGAA
jgi:hypothetical protein